MKLNDVKTKIENLVTKERAIHDAVVDNTPTAEQLSQLESIENDINSAKVLTRSLERIEERDRIAAESVASVQAVQRGVATDDDVERVSKLAFHGYLRGLKESTMSGEDKAIWETAKERGQVIGTDSKGGFTVPKYFTSEVIKALKFYGGMTEVVRVLTTTDGNEINMSTFDDTARKAVIVGETVKPANGEVAFGRVSLSAYKYSSGIFRISDELLTDSIIDVEAEVTMAMVEAYGRAFNEHFTLGIGATQPQGILHASAALGSTPAAAATLTIDNMVDLMYSLDKAYRKNAVFMFNDKTEAVLRKLKDSTGQPLWNMGDYAKGLAPTILGKEYVINNDMPLVATGQKSVVFGDFQKGYRARYVNSISIKRLNELYSESGEVGFVSFMRIDGKVLHAPAMKVITHA